jgi:hypothetical protein
MPIAVAVAGQPIPDALQDEFAPHRIDEYEQAVGEALRTWERALDGLVRFRRVPPGRSARLTLELRAEAAPLPDPERRVLGTTSLADACRVRGRDPDAERLLVDFEVPSLRLYLADEFGLLSPDQVEWIALHEIGHALGMRSHSPIPADLMYEVARDRITVHEGLSTEDVNSFVSLYQLPNGTIFGRVPDTPPEPEPAPDPGPPQLSIGPYVNPRLGFELRPPDGWTRVETERGMVAIDGATWDYSASFQIVVHRYPTIEAFLQRYAPFYEHRGRYGRPEAVEVDGRRGLRVEIAVAETGWVEEMTLVEVGDGRLFAIIGECPRESIEAYRPWFRAATASLEITELAEEGWPPRRD